MHTDIFHVRLINGYELIARYISTGQDDNYEIYDTPMAIEDRVNDKGATSIVLSKFIPFSECQLIQLNKNHIVSISSVNTDIEEYYYHSIKYNAQVIEKNMSFSIKEANEIMRNLFSEEVQQFALASANCTHSSSSVH